MNDALQNQHSTAGSDPDINTEPTVSTGLQGAPGSVPYYFSIAQLAYVVGQLIRIYPSTVWSVFTSGFFAITGTPVELYISPVGTDAGLLILLDAGQYEAIPLINITAVFVGAGTVYDPSIQYLAAPSPLPAGSDTSLLTAVQSYLPITADVTIYLGSVTQATGQVYQNNCGILVLSDTEGNTPIFLVPGKIATIVTNSHPAVQSSLPPACSPEKQSVSIKNIKIRR